MRIGRRAALWAVGGALVPAMLAASPARAEAIDQPVLVTPGYGTTVVGDALHLSAAASGATRVRYYSSQTGLLAESADPPAFDTTVSASKDLGATNGGMYTLWVVAFDDLGGESLPSYPSSIIRVDLQAEALFTPGTPPPGVLTNASSLTYAVDYAADIVCVQWRVDASLETDFTPCAAGGSMDEQQLPATPAGGTAAYTGTTFTLNGPEEGAHQVDVRVLDALGNSGVFHRAFTIDRTPPALAIVSGPAAGSTINQSFVTFGFTIEKGARYICGVDEPLINQSCSGGASHQASGLNDGSHSFSVRATDPAGNAAELSRGFNVSVGGGGGVNPETGAPMIGIADSRARGGRRLSATGRVVLRTRSAPGGRRISAFSVSRVRRATRIRVRCSGRGCPYRSRSYRLKQRGRIGAPLRGRTLGPRAVLEVTLVGKGRAASRSVRFRFRAPKRAPRRVVRCISRYGKIGQC